jgi:uncharacterized membrane protein YhaH (DUF805 family)
MGFGEAVGTCFRKYVVFSGRARRPEYWYWYLFVVLVTTLAAIVDLAIFGPKAELISTLTGLGLLLPSLAITVRRLHDIDRSGWWIYITLLPVVGAIILIVFHCLRSTPGPNRFGSDR